MDYFTEYVKRVFWCWFRFRCSVTEALYTHHLQVAIGCARTRLEGHSVLIVAVHPYAFTVSRSILAGSARARAFARTTGRKANAKIAGGLGSVSIKGTNPGARSARKANQRSASSVCDEE